MINITTIVLVVCIDITDTIIWICPKYIIANFELIKSNTFIRKGMWLVEDC